MTPLPQSSSCKGCGLEFPSKNAVFRHLKDTDGVCLSSADHADFVEYVINGKREKTVVLYGYWLPLDAHHDSVASNPDVRWTIRNGEDVAQFLVDTLEQYPNGECKSHPTVTPTLANESTTTSVVKINRSYGHVSRSDIVAQEDGTSAITEVLVTKLPPLVTGCKEQRWIDGINTALKQRLCDSNEATSNTSGVEIRVLGRHSMTVNNFNAETDVSHRRIEYLIPADFLFPVSRIHDVDQLPSFSDGLRSRKFTTENTANIEDGTNGDGDMATNVAAISVEDSTSHFLPYCQSPSPEILALLTSFKRKMQSLTTHIVDLDTNDVAAVFEKQSHTKKRQRNREYRNNGKVNNKPSAGGTLIKPSTEEHGESAKDKDSIQMSKNVDAKRIGECKERKARDAGEKANKKEMILRRKRYHNFTPTVMAHEFLAYRRMNRFYHRATLRFNIPSDRNGHDPNGVDLESDDVSKDKGRTPSSRPFLALSLSGDLFLKGQVCHAVGLLIALARGVIDDDFVDCVFDEEYPHLVPTPAVPSFAMYAGDVFYINIEGKAKAILTPRKTDRYENGWNDNSTIQSVRDWQDEVRERVARSWLDGGVELDGRLVAEKEWTESVLNPWAERAKLQLEEYKVWKSSSSRGRDLSEMQRLAEGTITANDTGNDALPSVIPSVETVDSAVPTAFEKVLYYLRQADASGMWPSTTLKRQLVMISSVTDNDKNTEHGGVSATKLFTSSLSIAHRKAKHSTEERSSAYAFVEGQGGASGSFSLGAMPGDKYLQPKSNSLFPELMKAAFELEKALCPHREPSSTIAVNRNAQFRPHTDSGAGAGQSTSLIVGLGTYVGGELMVEGNKMDIRYKAIEFDGWKQRHWTMPFSGERYSLVWFTPKGCEGINFDSSGACGL